MPLRLVRMLIRRDHLFSAAWYEKYLLSSDPLFKAKIWSAKEGRYNIVVFDPRFQENFSAFLNISEAILIKGKEIIYETSHNSLPALNGFNKYGWVQLDFDLFLFKFVSCCFPRTQVSPNSLCYAQNYAQRWAMLIVIWPESYIISSWPRRAMNLDFWWLTMFCPLYCKMMFY